jgi:hypothetical protein
MSHCREDAGELVSPVYDKLLLRGVSPSRMMEEPGLIERVTNVQPEPIFLAETDSDASEASST